jgi:hypothetical protein
MRLAPRCQVKMYDHLKTGLCLSRVSHDQPPSDLMFVATDFIHSGLISSGLSQKHKS